MRKTAPTESRSETMYVRMRPSVLDRLRARAEQERRTLAGLVAMILEFEADKPGNVQRERTR